MKTSHLFTKMTTEQSFSTAKTKLLIILVSTNMFFTAFADSDSKTNTSTKTTSIKKTKKNTIETENSTKHTKNSAKSTKATTSEKVSTRKNTTFSEEDLTVADGVDCEAGTPCSVVINTSREALRAIDEKRYSSVTQIVTPHFDFRRMTILAVGNNWKQATDDQKDQLVELFQELLIFTYSKAFQNFGGAKINITSSAITDSKAVVINQVTLPSAKVNNTNQTVKVEYNLINHSGSWMAYDIKIENASLILTYRNQFNEIVQKEQISGLIKQLQTKVKQLQAKSGSLKEINTADDNS